MDQTVGADDVYVGSAVLTDHDRQTGVLAGDALQHPGEALGLDTPPHLGEKTWWPGDPGPPRAGPRLHRFRPSMVLDVIDVVVVHPQEIDRLRRVPESIVVDPIPDPVLLEQLEHVVPMSPVEHRVHEETVLRQIHRIGRRPILLAVGQGPGGNQVEDDPEPGSSRSGLRPHRPDRRVMGEQQVVGNHE